MKFTKRFTALLLALLVSLFAAGCTASQDINSGSRAETSAVHLPDTPGNETGSADTAPGGKTQNPDASVPETNPSEEDETGSEETLLCREPETRAAEIDENGIYTTKEDVALYIHVYGKLPSNFITKKEAEALGWSGGSLEKYAANKCIGGSRFGNYEGRLPEKKGRSYTECDIDTLGAKSRGAKRIVFSNDGLIYYTQDHYETFELLYDGN